MTRRALLSLAVSPGLFPSRDREEAVSKVTVTGLETFVVKVNRRGNWLLARLQTSAGVTGLGDASHGGNDALTAKLLGQFLELLRGRPLFQIERLRAAVAAEVARQGRPAAVAFSALEQCLWDIQGQLFGVPCHALFGGTLRNRLRCYANINRSTEPRTPAGFAAMAERAVRDGFDAVKLAPFDGMPRRDAAAIEAFTQQGLGCAAAVRKVIGDKRDLLIDAHSNFDLERGLELARRFEPLNLFWLEEVTPARRIADLAAVNRAAKMPTAGGESIYGVKGFYAYIQAGAVDILMPDVKYCGGMLEMKKIAALGEAAGLPVSPHGVASPVGHFAAAHVCAGLPNFLILEYSYGEVPWRAELVDPPERLAGGHVELSGRPGLGLKLNDRLARQQAA